MEEGQRPHTNSGFRDKSVECWLGRKQGKQRKPQSPHRPPLKAPRPPQGWSRWPSQQRTEKQEGAEPRSPLTGLESGDQERTKAQEGAGEGTSSEGEIIPWRVQELPHWGLEESRKHTRGLQSSPEGPRTAHSSFPVLVVVPDLTHKSRRRQRAEPWPAPPAPGHHGNLLVVEYQSRGGGGLGQGEQRQSGKVRVGGRHDEMPLKRWGRVLPVEGQEGSEKGVPPAG